MLKERFPLKRAPFSFRSPFSSSNKERKEGRKKQRKEKGKLATLLNNFLERFNIIFHFIRTLDREIATPAFDSHERYAVDAIAGLLADLHFGFLETFGFIFDQFLRFSFGDAGFCFPLALRSSPILNNKLLKVVMGTYLCKLQAR